MSKNVFVYGTLKRGFPNHSHIADSSKSGSSKFIACGKTKYKYLLVVYDKLGNLPFLLNKKGIGKNVCGEVYEIDEKKSDYLDWFEDIGELYDAIDLIVITEVGKEVQCVSYVMHDKNPEILNYEHHENYILKQAKYYDTRY